MTNLAAMKKPGIVEQTVEQAFPEVEPGVIPCGSLVLLQLKLSPTKTRGGIVLLKDAVDTETDTTQVAKVVAVGPLAFHNRETQKLWPEGAWAKVGDFVRVAKYGGDRWQVPFKDELVTFVLMDDLTIKGIQPDPFYIKAYL